MLKWIRNIFIGVIGCTVLIIMSYITIQHKQRAIYEFIWRFKKEMLTSQQNESITDAQELLIMKQKWKNILNGKSTQNDRLVPTDKGALKAHDKSKNKIRQNDEVILKLKTILNNSNIPNNKAIVEIKGIVNKRDNQSEKSVILNKIPIRDDSNNTEEFSLSLPTIYNSLPHLRGYRMSLLPSRWVSKGRTQIPLVFGIPTVYRKEVSYLGTTLKSLISQMSVSEKELCMIIVFIGEQNLQIVDEIIGDIQVDFHDAVDSGLLEVITAPQDYYPDLNNLPITLNDSKERVKWRSKQNLDYVFMMMYAQRRAVFYVQLEDDVTAAPGYVSEILSFVQDLQLKNWFVLDFSKLGFIGKLFHSYDLSLLIEFLLMFYKDKPCDWLLDQLIQTKVCNPEKTDFCNQAKRKVRIRFKPSLFQHIGKRSSLNGKKQNLKDNDFKKSSVRHRHLIGEAVRNMIDIEKQKLFDIRLTKTLLVHVSSNKDDNKIMFGEKLNSTDEIFKNASSLQASSEINPDIDKIDGGKQTLNEGSLWNTSLFQNSSKLESIIHRQLIAKKQNFTNGTFKNTSLF